jgi:hypothetical protein
VSKCESLLSAFQERRSTRAFRERPITSGFRWELFGHPVWLAPTTLLGVERHLWPTDEALPFDRGE